MDATVKGGLSHIKKKVDKMGDDVIPGCKKELKEDINTTINSRFKVLLVLLLFALGLPFTLYLSSSATSDSIRTQLQTHEHKEAHDIARVRIEALNRAVFDIATEIGARGDGQNKTTTPPQTFIGRRR